MNNENDLLLIYMDVMIVSSIWHELLGGISEITNNKQMGLLVKLNSKSDLKESIGYFLNSDNIKI